MLKVTVTLTFKILTPRSIWIICGPWPFMIPRKVNLGDIRLKFMSGQDFTNAGQTDGQTGGRTDDERHNIKQSKIPSGVQIYNGHFKF